MDNNYKTLYEWRRTFKEKDELLVERGYDQVSPYVFYRDLFPVGSFQVKGDMESDKGNLIATKIAKGKKRSRQYIITDDLKDLGRVMGVEFGLIAPLSWYGKSHKGRNAHELYAMVVDIDYVGKQQLKNLLKQFGNGVQLMPTYLVSSGRGLHLYYFLKEPIQLYHNVVDTLSALKKALIRRLWNDTSSLKPDEPDITGIFQGFRCVGCQSKLGSEYIVSAYKMSGKRYTLEEIKASIPGCDVDIESIYIKPEWKADDKEHMPMALAKALYPEWYQERIIEGKKAKKIKKTWTCNVALYEWWKNKIMNEVKAGGRYYSLMALCMYGKKCGISNKQIREDAWSFYDHMESLTDDEANHFTKDDVRDALKCLRDKYTIEKVMTRGWIEEHTKVAIPTSHREKDKRMKQSDHLELARASRDIRCRAKGKKWTDGNGRPDKKTIVAEWRKAHPDGTKADCNRDTGMDPKTIRKWWNGEEKQMEKPKVTTEKQKPLFDYIVKLPDGAEVVVEMDHSDNKEEELQRIKTYLQKLSKS